MAGLNPALVLPIAILASALASYLIWLVSLRPLVERRASPLVCFIASLGVFTALEALFAMLFGTGYHDLADPLNPPQVFEFGGATLTSIHIVHIGLAILVAWLLWFLLAHTRFGRSVRAIMDDYEVSKIVGIDTRKVLGGLFLLSGAIAGLNGVLIGYDLGLTPTLGLIIVLDVSAAAIVGGIGSFRGGIVGALLVGFFQNFVVALVGSDWKLGLTLALLLLFLLMRPQGIFER